MASSNVEWFMLQISEWLNTSVGIDTNTFEGKEIEDLRSRLLSGMDPVNEKGWMGSSPIKTNRPKTLFDEEIQVRFTHHPPDGPKVKKHEFIRHECMKLAFSLNETLPECSETLRAIQKLEEVMFLANAAIARHKS